MVLGEHAVLHDRKAIVFAVDQRMHVALKPREDKAVIIRSALGERKASLGTLQIEKPFDFAIASMLCFKPRLKQGFELEIASDFSHQVGLGSSAALTVAVLAVLHSWLGMPSLQGSLSVEQWLFQEALQVIRRIQGCGSGADAAASVFGGALLYQQRGPYPLKRFTAIPPITVVYSGAKTPTAVVVQQVEALRTQYPNVIEALYDAIDAIVMQATLALDAGDWPTLGKLMNMQEGCMRALELSNPAIDRLITYLRQAPGIEGAKLSGAGLGDCVIALGHCATDRPGMPGMPLAVAVGSQGVICHG